MQPYDLPTRRSQRPSLHLISLATALRAVVTIFLQPCCIASKLMGDGGGGYSFFAAISLSTFSAYLNAAWRFLSITPLIARSGSQYPQHVAVVQFIFSNQQHDGYSDRF